MTDIREDVADITSHAVDFAKNRYCVINGAMEPQQAFSLGARIRHLFSSDPACFHHRQGEATGGGHSDYYTMDRWGVEEEFPELLGWYDAARWLVQAVTGQEVILSPHLRSAVNIKVYPPGSGSQGWHYDTNPLSAVLFLSSEGSPTIVRGQEASRWVKPEAGHLLVMAGRETLHSVPVNNPFVHRITVPMNYYTPGDIERPDWLDGVIYEGDQPKTVIL